MTEHGELSMNLKPGLLGTATLVVGEEHTAPRLGSGRAPVLATPIMVALMEAAAVDCVERLLDEGRESLGVRIEVDHTAGTPVGLAVTATAELKEVSGRKLTFYVEARDSREIIGKGRHERVVVDAARFRAKIAAKAGPSN
jgi:fluoroacetyl-CoA thioesterase